MLLPLSLRLVFEILRKSSRIKFVPPNYWSQSSQFPFSIYLSIEMLHHGVPMSFVLDNLEIKTGISLMCCPQLMMSNYLFLRNLLPFRRTDVMLSVHQRVTDEADMGHDADEIRGRHGVPLVSIHCSVIHLFEHMVGNRV